MHNSRYLSTPAVLHPPSALQRRASPDRRTATAQHLRPCSAARPPPTSDDMRDGSDWHNKAGPIQRVHRRNESQAAWDHRPARNSSCCRFAPDLAADCWRRVVTGPRPVRVVRMGALASAWRPVPELSHAPCRHASGYRSADRRPGGPGVPSAWYWPYADWGRRCYPPHALSATAGPSGQVDGPCQ
jgi:hypothetical protein